MNEKIEKLGKYSVFCSDIHKFGTDAVLLADFANPKPTDNMCEFGCGCGIITTLCCQKNEKLKVTAVDIQPDAIELTKKGVNFNGISSRVTPICADLKQLPSEMNGQFSLVVMNPPYKKMGAGLLSGESGVDIARFEVECNIHEICASAARLLKFHGRFCICHRPERLADAICAMKNVGITPKRLRTVSQNKHSKITLVLIEGTLSGGDGMVVEPPLFIDDEHHRLFADYFKENN